MTTFRLAWCGPPLAGGRTSLLALGATPAQLRDDECTLQFDVNRMRVSTRVTRLDFGAPMYFPSLEAGLRIAEGTVLRRLEFELAFLRNVDGIVFVVDAQPERMEANVGALERLRGDLRFAERDTDAVPLVFQVNKCDLVPEPVLDARLTWRERLVRQTVATRGEGVRHPVEALLIRLVGNVSVAQWKANELLQRPQSPAVVAAVNEFVAASAALNARACLPPLDLFDRVVGVGEDILNAYLALTPETVGDAEPRLRAWTHELRQQDAEWTNSRPVAGRGKNGA